LPALIAHAEKNGQVSGLLSDGLRLADANYLDVLLKTGLDHLMIIFQPERDEAWQALDYVLKADLFVAVHLTVTPLNSTAIPSLLKRLTESGVKTISLSATDQALGEHLAAARDKASELGLSLVWDLPVPYSTLHPVAYEIQENLNLSGAGRAWLYVEPDGDVLPTQGVNRVLGNWLADSWEKIWQQARAQ
jgi:MoaA/NifB/PqqE/SkfB family radical SAM enzyme